jgi:predicted RNA-binding Zn ribbon-like protein
MPVRTIGYMDVVERFHFVAGSPAFCLVDTVGNRGGAGIERLKTLDDLVAWLRAADLLANGALQATQHDLETARHLREAIYHCGLAAMERRAMARADVDAINRSAAKPPLRPQLIDDTLTHIGRVPVEAALSVLAADALRIFGTVLQRRIRVCPDCQMMFLDTSRPGRRRWCSSASGCILRRSASSPTPPISNSPRSHQKSAASAPCRCAPMRVSEDRRSAGCVMCGRRATALH